LRPELDGFQVVQFHAEVAIYHEGSFKQHSVSESPAVRKPDNLVSRVSRHDARLRRCPLPETSYVDVTLVPCSRAELNRACVEFAAFEKELGVRLGAIEDCPLAAEG